MEEENIIQKFEHYKKRPIKFIKQVSFDDWRIKVYGIFANTRSLPKDLVSKAIKNLLPHLPQPALNNQRYGVGFLIIHQGTMRNWFLLDWWENEDIMYHQLFSSPLENVDAISAEVDKSLIACVHELRVINFESKAWIKTALCNDAEPSFEKYLEQRMNEF